jgi:cytochrome c-type biogenesis protein CcmE
MKPKHRNRRLSVIAGSVVLTVLGAVLLLKALGDNKQLFVNPSNVVATTYVQGDNAIRIGGLVVDGSVQKPDGLLTEFTVIDFIEPDLDIPALHVRYEGVLPDLFREGQGVVLTGRLNSDHVFIASNVLAKHDENYMPKLPDS